jgi:hypothetical protein
MRETPKAAAAYAEYAAMGQTRSLVKLYEQLRQSNGKAAASLRTIEAWSSEHGWQARVQAHDERLAAEKERKRLAEIEAMNERQAMIGTSHQYHAIEQIKRLIADKKFGSQAAVQLLKLAVDVERTARGAPTVVERQEHSGTVTVEHGVSDSTDDEAAHAAATAFLATLAGIARSGVSKPDGTGDASE